MVWLQHHSRLYGRKPHRMNSHLEMRPSSLKEREKERECESEKERKGEKKTEPERERERETKRWTERGGCGVLRRTVRARTR